MKLLDEIIDGAASADARLADLLRKSLVLASRLKNEMLKDWCSAELDGYPNDSDLPPYRIFGCHSLGFLIGPNGSTMDRQPLALAVLEEGHRDKVEEVRISQGVAELNAMVESRTSELIMSPWSPNMTVMYQQKFYRGWVLNRAWREFPATRLTGICDTVRNRLLRLALELREEIGESNAPLERITPAQVQTKVVNHIYGGQNVIASTVGRDVAQASNTGVVKGDFASLSEILKQHHIEPDDIDALPTAIEADKEEVAQGRIGTNIHKWLTRAAKGAVKSTRSISIDVIAAAIRAYLGI